MKKWCILVVTWLVGGAGLSQAQAPDTIRVGIRTVNLALDAQHYLLALSEGRDTNFDGELDPATGELPGRLFRIDPKSRKVVAVREFEGFIAHLAVADTVGFLLQRNPARVTKFDTRTLEIIEDSLGLGDIQIYELNAFPGDERLYVGTGGFSDPGGVLVYDAGGALVHQLRTGFGASDVVKYQPDGHQGLILFVVNEGLFGAENATLSYFALYENYVFNQTGQKLGDTGNSLSVGPNGRFYFVMNGSHTVQIFDPVQNSYIGSVNVGTTGYNGPRQVAFLPGDTLGVVSTFNNDLRFFDLRTLEVVDSIQVGQKPEKMVVQEGKLFVANGGFTGFSEDSTVFVIDPQTKSTVDTIVTGIRTTQLVKSPAGNFIIALSEGRDSNFDGMLQAQEGEIPGRLIMINAATHEIFDVLPLQSFGTAVAPGFFIDGGDTLSVIFLGQKEPERISLVEITSEGFELLEDQYLLMNASIYKLNYDPFYNKLLVSTGFSSNELLVVTAGRQNGGALKGEIWHRIKTGTGTSDVVAGHHSHLPGTYRWYVLNEGFFGSGNASLTVIDFAPDLFSAVAGKKLGDTANGATLADGRLYIPVNGSHTVEVLDVAQMEYLGQVKVGTDGYDGPRQVAIIPGGSGLVTTYANDVRAFDLNSLEITRITPVGSKPEDILVIDNQVFVANGGFTGFAEDSTIFVFQDRAVPVESLPARPPRSFTLAPLYPNPFVFRGSAAISPRLNIEITLARPARVQMAVYNILGQKVADLVNRDFMPGNHRLHWDARDRFGKPVAAGTYFVRARVAGDVYVRPVMIRP